ncbi:hypothetical protein [Streptococcus dysgalactiae]|uniref:hypothetical protein n=1 Tax=Streptococcus dysgalactiae TaxID=1334 RepID=UPI003DA0F345
MIIKERNGFLTIPKSTFNLPSEEEAQALKELAEDMEYYKQKKGVTPLDNYHSK